MTRSEKILFYFGVHRFMEPLISRNPVHQNAAQQITGAKVLLLNANEMPRTEMLGITKITILIIKRAGLLLVLIAILALFKNHMRCRGILEDNGNRWCYPLERSPSPPKKPGLIFPLQAMVS